MRYLSFWIGVLLALILTSDSASAEKKRKPPPVIQQAILCDSEANAQKVVKDLDTEKERNFAQFGVGGPDWQYFPTKGCSSNVYAFYGIAQKPRTILGKHAIFKIQRVVVGGAFDKGAIKRIKPLMKGFAIFIDELRAA